VRNPINQEKTMRNDSRCIGPEENIQYQKAGSVAGYYYRDLESKKLSKRAFEGLEFNADFNDEEDSKK
ncbi:MAG: hypothetical protein KDD50_15000, partial [Bdellovibrionales bacterium]|nr:hypothetical protein [Bdellovibrionales bacterium]